MDSDQNCSHQVLRSKYERNAPEIKNWWHKLFDLLESDAAIPPDRRLDVINEIFPSKLRNKILSILSFIRPCKTRVPDEEVVEEHSSEEKQSEVSIYGSNTTDEAEGKEKHVGLDNPYLKFFRRRPDRAAIWHTLPPLSFDEMNLVQRAEAITVQIATDFVEWMQNISDEDSPTSLSIPLVLKMFEIGFSTDAARTLQVRVKEMASVPDGVAILKNNPDMAKRSQLHRQLLRDLEASKQPKKVFAFGTKLDKEYQFHPPKTSEIEKWLVCTEIPQDLESMAAVWQGITHLRSTRAYCEYLLQHPEIKPPQFLVDMKMLDRTTLKDTTEAEVPPRTRQSVVSENKVAQ